MDAALTPLYAWLARSDEARIKMGKLARIFFTGRASRKPTDRPDSEIKSLWRAFSDGGNRTQLPGRIPGSDRLANMPDDKKDDPS